MQAAPADATSTAAAELEIVLDTQAKAKPLRTVSALVEDRLAASAFDAPKHAAAVVRPKKNFLACAVSSASAFSLMLFPLVVVVLGSARDEHFNQQARLSSLGGKRTRAVDSIWQVSSLEGGSQFRI